MVAASRTSLYRPKSIDIDIETVGSLTETEPLMRGSSSQPPGCPAEVIMSEAARSGPSPRSARGRPDATLDPAPQASRALAICTLASPHAENLVPGGAMRQCRRSNPKGE
jgi:hypothetical protein